MIANIRIYKYEMFRLMRISIISARRELVSELTSAIKVDNGRINKEFLPKEDERLLVSFLNKKH